MSVVSVWIIGDQLLESHPALRAAEADVGRANVRVLLVESARRLTHRPYQRKKLVLLLSAMRHYAQHLREQGYAVDLLPVATFNAAVEQHINQHGSDRLVTMASASYSGRRGQEALAGQLGIPVDILPNTQFLVGRFNPIPRPEADKRYVMESFYRQMRRHFDILLEGDQPVGSQWNYDADNRRKLPTNHQPPAAPRFAPDDITQQAMREVAAIDGLTGTVEGFDYAVTRAEALAAFDDFITHRAANFGPYEDALTTRSHALYHSILSPYLNLGLLEPLELAQRMAQAYHAGDVPLNSAEGFIRQIIGWREFMFWQYWRQMPGMLAQNAWDAQRPLPAWVWSGATKMRCVSHAVRRAVETGYNHHIERLMVLSNFFLLAGINPRAVNDWFLSLYIDAYEWVMPPNVIGMGLNADDGLTATKPYIAGANYIDKMSDDYCGPCHYKHKQRTGERACPFNTLYWNFVLQHEERLSANPRTARNVWGLRHLDQAERRAVRRQAADILDQIDTL